MICTITKKIDGKQVTFKNSFMFKVPVAGKLYCSACEEPMTELTPHYGVTEESVINPNHQTERVKISMSVCKHCASDFLRYGCD